MSEDSTSDSDFDTTTISSTMDRSEDEIVWDISDEFSSESSLSDFILLPRTLAAAPIQHSDSGESTSESETELSLTLDSLSITAESILSKAGEELHKTEPTSALRQSNRGKHKENQTRGESQDTNPPSGSPCLPYTVTRISLYEYASTLITCYLDSPLKGRRTRGGLHILQAFIIELGISKDPPTTVTSAKKLLKAEAHINIADYIAVRGGDQDALRQIMHPSVKALRKSIQKTGKKKSKKWVKEQGLDVFLIGCYN